MLAVSVVGERVQAQALQNQIQQMVLNPVLPTQAEAEVQVSLRTVIQMEEARREDQV